MEPILNEIELTKKNNKDSYDQLKKEFKENFLRLIGIKRNLSWKEGYKFAILSF